MTTACVRCGAPSTTLMSFSYEERTVMLEDLAGADGRAGYAMCTTHGDRLTPPLGWTLTDRRNVARLFAPTEGHGAEGVA